MDRHLHQRHFHRLIPNAPGRRCTQPKRSRHVVAQVYRWSGPQSSGQPRKRENIFSNVDSDQHSDTSSNHAQTVSAVASFTEPSSRNDRTEQQDKTEQASPTADETVPDVEQTADDEGNGWGDFRSQQYRDTGWGEAEPVGDWGEWGPTTSPTDTWEEWDTEQAAGVAGSGGEFDQRYGGGQQTGASPSDRPWHTEDYEADGEYYPPDITVLSRREQEQILPLLPNGQQANYYSPKSLPERTVQVAASLMGVVVFAKSAAFSVPALLYPVWGPWVRAGFRNVELLTKKFKYTALWRAEVLDIELILPFKYQTGFHRTADVSGQETSVRIVVGDPWKGGARTELSFPFVEGVEEVRPGEAAELLVLSPDYDFQSFKVVREVYLPQAGLWLSEYPFVDRDLFLDVSLDIERSRQTAARAADPFPTDPFPTDPFAAGPGPSSNGYSYGPPDRATPPYPADANW